MENEPSPNNQVEENQINLSSIKQLHT